VPFKANAARRRRIPKQRYRVTNWAAYDAALRQRGSPTVWFSEEAIAAWRAEPRTTQGGQVLYSALAIRTALTLRAVFRLALRQTESLIGSILQLLGLDLAIPDHSTLSRRAETLDVPRPQSCTGPIHLLVDSTGLRLCGPGEWLVENHGTQKRRSWRKLHIGVDADTGEILASELTTSDVNDGSQVKPLLDQIQGPLTSIGEGAYDQAGIYGTIGKRHPEADVIVPPRSTAVPSEMAARADPARSASPKYRGAWMHGLADEVGVHSSCPGGGLHQPLQTRNRGCAALADGPASCDGDCHCHGCPERHARAWAPEVHRTT
jgi:hypothetical protein